MTNDNKDGNITFIIFTFNEGFRIKYPIKQFIKYGKVLIIDNYSTDDTVKTAKSFGADVIKYKNDGWAESEKEVSFILKNTKTDWVYWGSADELVSKKCLELYKKIALENKYKIVIQKRKTFIYDTQSEFYPCYVYMGFFRKDSIDFTDNTIHQRGKFAKHVKPEEVLYLPPTDEYSIFHYSLFNSHTFLNNVLSYSTFQSDLDTSKVNIFTFIYVLPKVFLKHLLFERSFRYGMNGFITAGYSAFYSFFVLVKKYEKQNYITKENMEKVFSTHKKELIKGKNSRSRINKIISSFAIIPISLIHRKYKFKKQKIA